MGNDNEHGAAGKTGSSRGLKTASAAARVALVLAVAMWATVASGGADVPLSDAPVPDDYDPPRGDKGERHEQDRGL